MIKTLFDVFKNRGLKFTFIYFKELMLFDLKYNTNTFLRKESIQFEDGIHYVSVFDSTLKKIQTEIKKLQLTNNFIFIDLGSGKGKPLLYLSSKFQNSKFLGIEIDNDLHEIAVKNQQSTINNQQSKINFVNDNCLNIYNYFEDYSTHIIYMFNPFGEKTTRNILNTLKQCSNQIFIVYVDPIFDSLILEFDYKKIVSYKGRYNSENLNIYKK